MRPRPGATAASLALALAAVAAIGWPGPALAHAELASSSPADGATLTEAPSEVRLVFSGELDPDGSEFTIIDAAGAEVGSGTLDLAIADRDEMAGTLATDAPGTYRVTWLATALDGHPEQGTLSFTVAAPAEAEPPDTALRPDPPPWTLIVGIALLAAALLLAVARGARAARAARALRRWSVAPVALLALGLTGCIPGGSGCEDLPDRLVLTVAGDGLDPTQPAVCRDREVTLVLEPEVDGVFHIHGFDEQVPATTVTAGQSLELTFTTARSGQFPIELHTDAQPQGVDIGILTVREP